MKETFLLTLGQCGIMFAFIAIGFALSKGKVLTDAKPLSKALVWVFLPAVVFNVFYENCTVDKLGKALPYLLAGIVVMLLCLALFHPILKRYKDRITRNTYLYSMLFTNMAYMGFPLIQGVFPELYLFFVVFTIGLHVYIFTIGAMMFAPEGNKFSLKGLLSPIIIAMVLGMLCGPTFDALDIRLPKVAESILGTAAGCMSPIAMLVTGIALAKLPVVKMLQRVDVYVFTAIRLLAIPAVFGSLAYLCHRWFGLDIGVVKVVIIYCALPMGLNPVVFTEANGGDGTIGAQCAFISHICCLATMPFAFGLVALL